MNRKKTRGIIAIIFLMSFLIPTVQAPNIQVSPIDTEDDAFITGIGAYFGDTPYLFLKEENQDIIIGNRFRNVAIPQGAKINNATLFVRSIYNYDAAGDLSVTIYGHDSDNSNSFNDSGSFTRTYTDASRIWNISEVNGNQWSNVSVTEIVQEIISRVGWASGNSLSLIMLAAQGTPRREFVSVDGNPAYTAYIEIFYNEEPTDPQEAANPPFNDTDKFVWEFNSTYRGIDIWYVWDTNTSGNRGPNAVNWRRLNLTQLTEIDSGNAITVNNASWASLSGFQAQQINSLYNDTGSLGIDDFFIAMAVNLSAITRGGIGSRVATVAAFSTLSPVGGAGLLNGVLGEFAGVVITLNSGNERFTFRLVNTKTGGGGAQYSTPSQTFEEDDNEILYILYSAHRDWHIFNVFSNPDFTGGLYQDSQKYVDNLGPFRYSQAISSVAYGTSFIHTGEYYTFPNLPDADPLIFLIYPNGTFVCPGPCLTDEPTPDEIKDFIDDLLGGVQPEDPQEEEYPVIGKFQWKLLVLAVGMIMLLGSPIAGVYYGGDTATWIKILFIMFFGIGILWQIKSM